MHMADALLSPQVGGVMYAVSAGALAYSVAEIRKRDSDRSLPLMAVSGAFVFSAQMINFTIPGTGSSGHICGGILLAGLLGGGPALLTLATVLLIQCLFFADGGLLALGANIFNMAVIPCLFIYPLIFKPILKKEINRRNILIAAVLSCVIGLQLGAFSVVLETLASGITELPFKNFVLLMQPIHLAIGFAEGLITAAVLQFVHQMQPEILESSIRDDNAKNAFASRRVWITFAVITLLVGGGLSLYASSHPDGLEWSIEGVTGQTELERENEVYTMTENIQNKTAILPDYDYKNDGNAVVNGTSFSGILGSILTFLFAGIIGTFIQMSKKNRKSQEARNG